MSEPTDRPTTGAHREALARFLSGIHDGIGDALLFQGGERGTTTPVGWDGEEGAAAGVGG
jgi:hypothetical protein